MLEGEKNETENFWKDKKGGYQHGTTIQTGITCKDISCYIHDSACRWFIVDNAKIFRSYLFPLERNYRILIGLCK